MELGSPGGRAGFADMLTGLVGTRAAVRRSEQHMADP